jgi:hypothetical protein
MTDTISARQAVEKVLAQRISQDPAFITQLALDPDGAVKPLISEIMSDDGELDLSDVSITVHVETDDRIHLVVPAGAGGDEVSGFSLRTGAGSLLRGTSVRFDPMGGMAKGGLESHSGVCVCDTEDCTTQVYCDLTKSC